ncbi:hypothetical protein QCA50_011666 [Cerrena zonata]|uniref:G domain-containing protein n=1 Tax=Cerrena zonata TaxID=2478898 RepID=A0AAW0FW63_9APHY
MSETIIAVMGATGTGKSTFINLVSGANFEVGTGLLSCSKEVQSSQPFDVNGRKVVMIDTPGFDDSTRSDTDILRTIATYLADTYRSDRKLSGIIYMHRISDPRMSGISRRNFGMFRKLCGDNTLSSVVLVTNMWSQVSEDVGAARELQLQTDELLFKPVLDKGARMKRNYNTLDSARHILEELVGRGTVTLQIQEEVVMQNMGIEQTAAGVELEAEKRREIEEAKRKQEEELRRVQEELRRQMEEEERRRQKEMEQARIRAEQEAARHRRAQERERARQEEERRKEEMRRWEIQRQIEAEAEQRRQRDEEARRIQEEMRQQREEAEAEERRLREQIDHMEHQDPGPCVIF